MPATHYIQITRGIMVRGAAIVDLIQPEAVLLAIALVLIVVATMRFEKSVE
jgi:ABC-2 type transport system permease protein